MGSASSIYRERIDSLNNYSTTGHICYLAAQNFAEVPVPHCACLRGLTLAGADTNRPVIPSHLLH